MPMIKQWLFSWLTLRLAGLPKFVFFRIQLRDESWENLNQKKRMKHQELDNYMILLMEEILQTSW